MEMLDIADTDTGKGKLMPITDILTENVLVCPPPRIYVP